jgi:hypothetical protein
MIIIDTSTHPNVVVTMDVDASEVDALCARYCTNTSTEPSAMYVGEAKPWSTQSLAEMRALAFERDTAIVAAIAELGIVPTVVTTDEKPLSRDSKRR